MVLASAPINHPINQSTINRLMSGSNLAKRWRSGEWKGPSTNRASQAGGPGEPLVVYGWGSISPTRALNRLIRKQKPQESKSNQERVQAFRNSIALFYEKL